MAFALMSLSGFLYPQIGAIKIIFAQYSSLDKIALIILWFAKLGASTVHSIAYMFIIW